MKGKERERDGNPGTTIKEGLNSASRGDGSGRNVLEIIRGNISEKKSVKTFQIRPSPRLRKKSMRKTSKIGRIRNKNLPQNPHTRGLHFVDGHKPFIFSRRRGARNKFGSEGPSRADNMGEVGKYDTSDTVEWPMGPLFGRRGGTGPKVNIGLPVEFKIILKPQAVQVHAHTIVPYIQNKHFSEY